MKGIRIGLMLLAAAAALPLMPVYAAEETSAYYTGYAANDNMTEYQGFYIYPGTNGTAILDGVVSSMAGAVEIPESFTYTTVVNNQTTKRTLKITYINKGAFKGCQNIEQVTIPDSVVRIGDEAFADCPKLKVVQFSTGADNIQLGRDLFAGSDQVRIYGNFNDAPAWLGQYRDLFAGRLATEGSWKQSANGKWWFCYFDESWPADGFHKIDGLWYYFDDDGYRQTGWIKDNNAWYYLAEDGVMAKSTWIGANYVDQSGRFIPNAWKQSSNGKWWYRFGDGTYPKSAWAVIDHKKYLFDAGGWMMTGWVQLAEGWYHLADNGALDTNTAVDDAFVNSDGLRVEDTWEKVDGKWHYRYANGTLAKDGLTLIKDDHYYFDSNGTMKTGWIQLDGGWYYFRSSGEMAKDAHIGGYYVDENGLWQESE